MATKFVLEKDSAGRFRFRLLSQGRVLASSESYTTKRAAQNAIASVKSGAGGAVVVSGNRMVDKSWVYGPVESDCGTIQWSDNALVTIDGNYNVTGTVGPLPCHG